MPTLFEPLRLRGVTLRNRIGVSPMCQYSAVRGLPQTWHLTHYGARACGGAGLVMAEATAVEPRGRISLGDTGLWNDAQARAWRPIAEFVASQGAVPGIQLAHAGRKAGTAVPWEGGKPYALPPSGADGTVRHSDADTAVRATGELDGWREQIIAPTALPFNDAYQTPRGMTPADMADVRDAFVAAARRAHDAGFKVLELHCAHGYLLHSFLSPLTNRRPDAYGGALPGRVKFPLEVVEAVRAAWPDERPLFVRLSCTDWLEGGWDLEQSRAFARLLKKLGVDLLDCSSGGTTPESRSPAPPAASGAAVPGGHQDAGRDARATDNAAGADVRSPNADLAPLYQLPFAAALRREAAMPTAAVGLITTAQQAQRIVQEERADLVLLGRAMLRDPCWALHAAGALGAEVPWPRQYLRAQ